MFSLAMTQVTQEDLTSALEGLKVQLLGRINVAQQSEQGARHAVDSLQAALEVLKKEFFDHVSIVEDKFKGDVEEARRQLVAVKGDIAEAKTRLSSLTAHVPETSVLPLHLTRRKGSTGSPPMAEVSSGRTGVSQRFAGSRKSTNLSRSSCRRSRG